MSFYYVDAQAGDDSSDGRSRPWRTLAKVNASRFLPGDQVLLRCGQVWPERLVASSSGAVGNPLVYGAYGTGPHPVIDRGGTAWPGVQVQGKGWVTVKWIDVHATTNVAVWVQDGEHVRVEGVGMKNTKAHGISVEGASPNCTLYNNTLELDPGFVHAGSFIHVQSAKAAGVNVSYNRGKMGGALGNSNGIIVLEAEGALLHHNQLWDATEGIGVKATTRNVGGAQVYLNAVYDTREAHGDGEAIECTGTGSWQVVGAQVRHNLVERAAGGGIDGVRTRDCAVWGNIVLGWCATAFHWTSLCLNLKLYNNLCWDADYGALLDPDCTGEIRNNIMLGCSSRGIAATAGQVEEDYNLFWGCGKNNLPPGAHSLAADPRLLRYPPLGPGDCRLQTGSPGRGSGERLGPPGSPYEQLFDPGGSELLLFPYPLARQGEGGRGWSRGAFAY